MSNSEMTEEYKNFDVGYSSTVQPKKTISLEPELCPYHEKIQKQRDTSNKKACRKANNGILNSLIRRFTFKSNLEEKLRKLGIKTKVKVNKKGRIQPANDDENERGDNLTLTELQSLSTSQLEMITEAMQAKISQYNDELKELSEENERLSSDKVGLKLTVRNLEEISLRVMKPWVNAVPESDELTRVMLLN